MTKTESRELREVLDEVERVYDVRVTATPKPPRSKSRYGDQADWHPRRSESRSEDLIEAHAEERDFLSRVAGWRK